jgi:hypothetical protein
MDKTLRRRKKIIFCIGFQLYGEMTHQWSKACKAWQVDRT